MLNVTHFFTFFFLKKKKYFPTLLVMMMVLITMTFLTTVLISGKAQVKGEAAQFSHPSRQATQSEAQVTNNSRVLRHFILLVWPIRLGWTGRICVDSVCSP